MIGLRGHPLYAPVAIALGFAIMIAEAAVDFLEWPIFDLHSAPVDAAIWVTRRGFVEPLGKPAAVVVLIILGLCFITLSYRQGRNAT